MRNGTLRIDIAHYTLGQRLRFAFGLLFAKVLIFPDTALDD